MTKPITDIDDPRLVKALAHPLRVRIMGILERRSASPKQLALELDAPLENLSYHVRALRDFKLIELERERVVRGTIEHYYRAVGRPRITARAWERLPQIVREALDYATLSEIFAIVISAASQDKMDRPESHINRHYAVLDEEGFAEASQAVSELTERFFEIERRARKRMRRHEHEVPTMLISMLFDAPEGPRDDEPADPHHRRAPRRAPAPARGRPHR